MLLNHPSMWVTSLTFCFEGFLSKSNLGETDLISFDLLAEYKDLVLRVGANCLLLQTFSFLSAGWRGCVCVP